MNMNYKAISIVLGVLLVISISTAAFFYYAMMWNNDELVACSYAGTRMSWFIDEEHNIKILDVITKNVQEAQTPLEMARAMDDMLHPRPVL